MPGRLVSRSAHESKVRGNNGKARDDMISRSENQVHSRTETIIFSLQFAQNGHGAYTLSSILEGTSEDITFISLTLQRYHITAAFALSWGNIFA